MIDRRYTESEVEAALCLWEYALLRQTQDDDSVFDWLRAGEGTAVARQQCIELAKDLENSYQRAVTLGYDDLFDWEFVPRWCELAMEISKEHDLVEHWIEYIGMEIYRELERNP